jgi:oxysterol-binding protein 1
MKIARLNMDPQDKLRFEIHGKSSVKYHLRANHQVEAKRWYWALNNAIQWTKDEAREEEKRSKAENDVLRQAKLEQQSRGEDSASLSSMPSRSLHPSTALSVPLTSANASTTAIDDEDPANTSLYEPSVGGADLGKMVSQVGTATIEGDEDDEDEYGDDGSSHEVQPVNKDAFNITAQSVRLQLDLLAQVSTSLAAEREKHPDLAISDPITVQALSAYDSAVGNLKSLVGDILRISKDRDAYWQYRLDREMNIRQMWEESMAKVAREQEQLESKIGETEERSANERSGHCETRSRISRWSKASQALRPTKSTSKSLLKRQNNSLKRPALLALLRLQEEDLLLSTLAACPKTSQTKMKSSSMQLGLVR